MLNNCVKNSADIYMRVFLCTSLNIGKLSDASPPIKAYKYKIEQTSRGARVTVHGDAIDEIVTDYARLRMKLESEGFKVAPEE